VGPKGPEPGRGAAAHKRLEAARQIYVRSTGGQLWGRPPSALAAKYLLSGKLMCATCGASMTVRTRQHAKRRVPFFTCASWDHRGATVWANASSCPRPA
jgi:hypothetical protein